MTNLISFLNKSSPYQLKEEQLVQKIGLISIVISLVIIMVIMSLFLYYTKQKLQQEIVSDGLTLTSMLASYSINELKKDNANKLMEIVKYIGSKSGLIYSIIMDTNQKIIAHTGSIYVDSTLIAKRAASSNNPLQQIYEDSRTNYTIYEFSHPFFSNGKKEGTVRLGFAPEIKPLFSDSDIRGLLLVITLFFSFVPLFYYLVRSSLRLHTLSMTDELTGLYNRRGFFLLAENQLKLAKRAKRGVMLLYADMDDFKEINDTLGHDEGDRLIKETAAILKSTFRTSDIIARIGGDEFVVFPVGTEKDHIGIIANRLQENIENFNARNNHRYKLGLSIGIAKYKPNSAKSIDELLTEADNLMYKHKNSKNKDNTRSDVHVRSFSRTGG